jgi:hypothetical protein
MSIKDNSAFEWAKNHVSYEPDFIYFDEQENEDHGRLSDNPLSARLIISMLLSASQNNLLTLREAGAQIGKSHEYVRLVVESIKKDFPELYGVLTENKYKVETLVPQLSKKWTIINLNSNRTYFCDSLLKWSEEQNIPYHVIRNRVEKKDGYYSDDEGNKFKIRRNY